MRKILMMASAIAVLAGASAAVAGDITVAPQQVNHPWPTQIGETTVYSVTLGNKLTASGAGVGNIFTADSNGNLTVNGLNNYSASQSSDTTGLQAQTGKTRVDNVTVNYGGANVSSNGIGNQMGLTAAGTVYIAPLVTQQNTGHQFSRTDLGYSTINGDTVASSGATGNVLTASGNAVVLANNGTFATQSTDHTRVAITDVTHSTFNGNVAVNAQAGANAIELSANGGGISLASVQADGQGFGSGLNQIAGWPGSSESARANLSNVTVTNGNTTVGATAFGNNLTADAAWGGNIAGSLTQIATNVGMTSTSNVSFASFTGTLNASSLSVGNSASLKTH